MTFKKSKTTEADFNLTIKEKKINVIKNYFTPKSKTDKEGEIGKELPQNIISSSSFSPLFQDIKGRSSCSQLPQPIRTKYTPQTIEFKKQI